MTFYHLILIGLIASVAPNGGTAYDIPEGQTRGFIVDGAPVVEPLVGTVDVTTTPLAGGSYLVTLRCVSSPTGRCTGTVSGS